MSFRKGMGLFWDPKTLESSLAMQSYAELLWTEFNLFQWISTGSEQRFPERLHSMNSGQRPHLLLACLEVSPAVLNRPRVAVLVESVAPGSSWPSKLGLLVFSEKTTLAFRPPPLLPGGEALA